MILPCLLMPGAMSIRYLHTPGWEKKVNPLTTMFVLDLHRSAKKVLLVSGQLKYILKIEIPIIGDKDDPLLYPDPARTAAHRL